jgi:carbon-monoxide dehydrogenase small subunit
MERAIQITLNGEKCRVLVEAKNTLLEVIRDTLGFMGTKEGCGRGQCGACTILLDDKAVPACLVLAMEADGKEVTTIEGLPRVNTLHPIQKAFVEHGAIQCGFCTPGMIVSAKALLDRNVNPTETEILANIEGNLCRCTGYVKIVEAIKAAGEIMREEQNM